MSNLDNIFLFFIFLNLKTTTAGIEPARDFHNRFQVCLLNHSDKLPFIYF